MKKVALVFVIAVLLPSLVLAWLAVRSLRDQQFLLERQQSLLYQRVTDSLANEIAAQLNQAQQEFRAQVESLVADSDPATVAKHFDEELRERWSLAEVGFSVTLSGKILSPSPAAHSEARSFVADNSAFLCNIAPAEIYNNASFQSYQFANAASPTVTRKALASPLQTERADSLNYSSKKTSDTQSSFFNSRSQARKVAPQNVLEVTKDKELLREESNLSKVVPERAEFAQIVGDNSDGMLVRFLQNKLRLMFWHRLEREPDLVFGAQLYLDRVVERLQPLIQVERELQDEICIALLDDNAKPVAVSRSDFQANWKRPFAATEIGEALPHWEIAAYLINPAQFTAAAQTTRLTLGLLIVVLLLAIGFGGWLIVADINRQLALARQKTDFVSNVSHELKTPLTSIRMFSDLLAEGRVEDETKRRSYFNIITAETARLTRLINNVLDFSRMERGERKYNFQKLDFFATVRETVEIYRPHLESNGFKLDLLLPDSPAFVSGDRDALSQVIVNLLSNAEKYSGNFKEVRIEAAADSTHANLKVLDRGPGVPRGCESKIFEQFYRANDSLSSGIQGSGLGLTLARQIARAHGGDVTYEPRPGGGSCFCLRIPTIA